MQKIKITVIMMALVLLGGCQSLNSPYTELVYEKLSEKEEYLLNLTGNKASFYHINNLPIDKDYEILLTYEFYRNGEEIKKEIITSLMNDHASKKEETKTLAINIQEDKIRFLIGEEGAYASGSYELEETLDQYSQSFFSSNINLEIGTEIYIYQANSADSTRDNVTLGIPINMDELKRTLNANDNNVFIKLTFKEI
ncbi:hypothetical protein [Cellulosilyticum sp. WCF-2]|uniref:hypothetical protein n=1 Tax=Cellulosilyticum sp. WCF-2 TaxID=2497860 RepID=UPI000F8EA831|nr:hypothetical protein [Cellulosilyticum sp. WCF-2]QEH70038.1 hypothetical protein EKH84_17230 [Cellulosilyticum sp. WCF-2]